MRQHNIFSDSSAPQGIPAKANKCWDPLKFEIYPLRTRLSTFPQYTPLDKVGAYVR
jgi:hypothetical protein